MSFWRFNDNLMTVMITGADLCKSLTAINDRGIKLYHLCWENELSIQFQCSSKDVTTVRKICKAQGDDLNILHTAADVGGNDCLRRRWCLLTGIVVMMLLTLFLPTRVLFFRVEGNERIEDREILTAAENCGIRFGISRRRIRSENMKNALLSAIPELKWAGINTYGCTAVISVRECEPQKERHEWPKVGSIISARDGYVTSCTVIRGNALCKPGEVVQAGQVLISGYNDCGLCIRLTSAEGEIYANTTHKILTVMPSKRFVRTIPRETVKKISLIIGKKRIKLWKDSGIWDTTCGRIYEEYYITLPGDFRLPFYVAVETITKWTCQETECSNDTVEVGMKQFAHDCVMSRMVSGEILEQDHYVAYDYGCVNLSSVFLCTEMIGRTITEEIGDFNGKTN